jgi:hypothetical protein
MDTKDLNGPAPEEQSGNERFDTGNSQKADNNRNHMEHSRTDEAAVFHDLNEPDGDNSAKSKQLPGKADDVKDPELISGETDESRTDKTGKRDPDKPETKESSPATEPDPEKAGEPGPEKTSGAGYEKPEDTDFDRKDDESSEKSSGEKPAKDIDEYKKAVKDDKKSSSETDEPDEEGSGNPDTDQSPKVKPDENDSADDNPAVDDSEENNPEEDKKIQVNADEDKPSGNLSKDDKDKLSDTLERDPAEEKESSEEKPEEGDGYEKDLAEDENKAISVRKDSADYQNMEKEELLSILEELIESKTVQNIRDEVEAIKVSFYKRHKSEIELRRKKFMQEGGDAEAFEPGEDSAEIRFKELYRKYRHSKAAHNRSQEQNKQANLEDKLKVIEDLKELVNRNEDINRTFPEFRNLQKRWHSIGMVPQQNLKDLWDTYHHYVETFYDHIKINKELRDLDLKKNLETKIELCEKAEELLLSPNIINAFRQLQKYHDQWRETGPVPRDQKDVIWERFREVTHQINKKHQDHFDKQKESQRKNLEAKSRLCEKAEEINDRPFENFQQVEKLTKDMISLQRTWKTIGFAPKKDNTKIYQRFRNACDRFFAKKRDYNSQNKELLTDNLQKKLDLCLQAEALRESSDWKKTTDELIDLQNRWKEIGPVPRKHYDPVWKRFRAACDHFFNRKSEFFSTIDSKYEENLQKKLDIIEKIENFKFGANVESNLNTLKEYQRQWVSIGFVPIREKDSIQKRYRAALDKHFEGLKMDDQKKNLVKYKHKLEGVKEKPTAFNKLKFEREKFLNKFKQLESDITLWENNIGFFAKSKSAEATINEFREKIEQGKKQMEMLEEKIRMIDDLDNE